MIMFFKYLIILSFLLLQVSCDKQSTPFVYSPSDAYMSTLNQGGSARDFVILKDVNAENFYYSSFYSNSNLMIPCSSEIDEFSCDDRFWCGWNSNQCDPLTKDLLLVANEFDGLLIYEILSNQNDISLSLIYSNNGFEYTDDPLENIVDLELRSIYYSEQSQTLFVLDKFEYVYNIYLPALLIDDSENNNCSVNTFNPINSLVCGAIDSYHATQFSVNESGSQSGGFGLGGVPTEIFILNKHNSNNELYLDESYSEVQLINYTFPPLETACFGNGSPTSSCVSENIDNLSYNVTDVHFNNDFIFVGNPSDDYYSFNVYQYNSVSQQMNFIDEMVTSSKVSTLNYALNNQNEGYIYWGQRNGGCYITLLPANGFFDGNNTIFHLGESFTVNDIEYDSDENILLLSCGSDGVLVYDWNDDSGLEPVFIGHFTSSYAYKAKLYNGNTVIVGTELGLELFNIGE